MVEIRSIAPADEADWRRLWRAYLAFYETALPEEVYAASFARLTNPAVADHQGLIAVAQGAALGLAHYIFHRHGWRLGEVCYLQDLYVAPEARGCGLGRKLMEGVFAAADAAGRSEVYWLTQRDNTVARRLYDRIGVETPFVKYRR